MNKIIRVAWALSNYVEISWQIHVIGEEWDTVAAACTAAARRGTMRYGAVRSGAARRAVA